MPCCACCCPCARCLAAAPLRRPWGPPPWGYWPDPRWPGQAPWYGTTTITSYPLPFTVMLQASSQVTHQASRAEIDRAFAGMADDPVLSREAETLEREFAPLSWEALRLGEADAAG